MGTSQPAFEQSDTGEPIISLGQVDCPSGDLIVVDFGMAHLWSGADVPTLNEFDAPDEVVERANSSADFMLVGRDAEEVVAMLNLGSAKGRYVFDWLGDQAELEAKVDGTARDRGLIASVQPIDRMPHQSRLRALLDEGLLGMEVPFHGMWAVAVRGIPRTKPLPVFGQRMAADGPDAARWHSIWVQCTSEQPAQSIYAGHVLVDMARLMFSDARVFDEWNAETTPITHADVVFWGRDAAQIAGPVGADSVDDGTSDSYGWTDLTMSEAIEKSGTLQELQSQQNLRFAYDFRPHDDDHALLDEARRSSTQSGSIEVSGHSVVGYFTSWGDGAFPVYRDVSADGTLCRVRVELGSAPIVTRQRRFDERQNEMFSEVAIATAKVAREKNPVGWMYREVAEEPGDSGWRVFDGTETPEYLDDPENAVLVTLRELMDRDPALEPLFRTPAPAAFERTADGFQISITPDQLN